MNNFLTPIVFVSNNYHGVTPKGQNNNEFQEYIDFDNIKQTIGAYS